jgi:shikimate kinase
MNSKIRDYVVLNTKSFWLHLDINLLEKRLTDSKKRPLLNNKNIRTNLEKIYKERRATYSLASHKINCNNLNTKLITKKIVALYENI